MVWKRFEIQFVIHLQWYRLRHSDTVLRHLTSRSSTDRMGKRSDISVAKVAQMVALRNEGFTEREIASRIKCSRSSVHKCLTRYQETGEFVARKRPQRQRITSVRTDSMIHRYAKMDPTITSTEISSMLSPDLKVSPRTIRRRLLIDFSLKSCKAAKKPLLSDKNKKDRLVFCNLYKNWSKEDWHKVMFSDESTVSQYRNHITRVRRPSGERYNVKFTIGTVKHPKTVMFWGAISACGRGPLWIMPAGTTINSTVYLSVLKEKLAPWMDLRNCSIFQQDGAPCHKAKIVKTWMNSERITLLENWPGSSPDLNPIEHCWTVVKKKVADMHPTSELDLIEKLKTVWTQDITENYCRNLIESMPDRIQAVLKAQGDQRNIDIFLFLMVLICLNQVF